MRRGSSTGWSVAIAVLAAVLTPPAAVAAGAGGSTGTYGSATTGIVAPAGGSNLAPQSAGAVRASRGTRRIPRTIAPAAAPSSLPQAAATPVQAAPPALAVNFNGVSSRDSGLANFGTEFEPPDQGLCVGNGFVVEMVNSAYTVYDTSGRTVAGPFQVNGPFNEGLSEFTSDPRCYFDQATHTWFATILTINPEETASTIDIAVNPSGDPTTQWSVYRINTTDVGRGTGPKHPGCPCLGDQPTLGIDAQNLYVTTNEFGLASESFNGAQIYAFAKKDLVSLSPVHFVHFDKLAIAGAPASSVQPALTTGVGSAEYFLSSIDPTLTFDQRIGVWAITERDVVAKGGVPRLSSVVVSSEAFGTPPFAQQKGGASALEPGDDRMQQVQFAGGAVWGELDTSLAITGDPTARAAAAWFEIKPAIAAGSLSAAHIRRQGYVAVAGNYVLYPALQVAASGGAAMVMTISGAKRFPSAAYATLAPGAGSFGPVTVAAAGTSAYDPEGTRWGDYSWAVRDPSGSSVWLATEYVPPRKSQTADRARNWGTRVLDVPGP
jgi:hypothetical protein